MVSELVSRVNITLEIKGKGKIPCELKRHLSPRTVGLIVRSLPISGNVHQLSKSAVYIEAKIHSGMERKKTDFKRGDIAYIPTAGSICFYLDDMLNTKSMTLIGKLQSNIDGLREIKPGDVLTLY